MLGNCATGKVRMVSVPTSTKMMEITMATMGRFMKNFDIGLFSLGVEWLRVHDRACAHLLHAFSDDLFPAIHSVRDDPLRANTVADCDGSNVDLVVGVYHGNLVAALQF